MRSISVRSEKRPPIERRLPTGHRSEVCLHRITARDELRLDMTLHH